ncbi:hypothetical protein NM688_g2134 [Phlebia brevispora]|uniref:Uncharacterized protein n=1 Tax=Phlebia brevispora TaxID=194682 RepID=A0ACC1T998_9APHY|nr:hypothetical protein NM688_g2134 [Phlebia brevispora]
MLAAAYASIHLRRTRKHSLPGPSPWPIIGNVLPFRRAYLTLTQLRDVFGPIYTLRFFRTHIVVLSSHQVARELLEGKRSAAFSARPLPRIVELAGMDRGIVFEANATRLRIARNLLKLVLQPRELAEYRAHMEYHIVKLLNDIYEEPDDAVEHIRTLTAGITLRMSHGYDITGRNDPYVEMANETVQNFAKASKPPGYLVDWLPFLAYLPSWLPGMGFKRTALSWRQQYTELAVKGHRMAEGKVHASLTSKALGDGKPVDESILMFTATQLYTGGADTSVSTLSSFILAMMRYPDVQRKAQEELDHVLEGRRLPQYGDRATLPYVESLMKEILRCYPPIPAIYRTNEGEELYGESIIEKNSVIIVNFWGMLHDETVYPDCNTFSPERWLAKQSTQGADPLDVVFGFGRRACPGRHLAEELIFLSMASILALFSITKPLDSSGKPIEPNYEYTDGGIIFPASYRSHIHIRSEEAEQLLKASFNAL